MSRRTVTASTSTSFCSTRTPGGSPASCGGRTRCSGRVNSARADLSIDRRDSAPGMLKAVVTDETFNWGDDRPPAVPWADTVIYEAHLRGLTMLHEHFRPNERGTFAALGNQQVIDYLRRLGTTAIELLPVHAFLQDRYVAEKGRNYWG